MKFSLVVFALWLPVTVSAQNLKPAHSDSVKIKSFIIPAVLISYGVVSLGNNAIRDLDFSTRNELQEDHPKFANSADDYMRFVPMVAFYGLSIAGVKSKHGVANGTALYVLSEAIMGASTFAVKRLANRNRPDGSNNYSFPSGHTSSAFAAA